MNQKKSLITKPVDESDDITLDTADDQDDGQSLIPKMRLSKTEIREIFDAKCDDFGIQSTDQLYDRFETSHCKKSFTKIFEMNSSSLGPIATATVCKIISLHPHIKVVSLSSNSMGDEGALCVANLIFDSPHIISVDVSSNSIRDYGARGIFYAMTFNKSVVSLSIGSLSGVSRNSFGNQAVNEMATMLSTNKVLSELDISQTEITSDTILPIAKGLKFNNTLRVLNLANNNIMSKGCKRVLNAIMNSTIYSLNLSNNHIKDDTGPDFVKYLSKNRNIKILNLAGNDLTKIFMKTTCNAFANFSTISELNLSHNPLGGVGIDEFGHAISVNRTLKVLNISMCKIEFNGFESFCTKLENNKSITNLNLSHNPIGDNGAQSLAAVIRRHVALVDIDLELCEITDVGGDVLIPEFGRSPALERVSMKNNLIRNSKIILAAVQQNPKIIYFNIEFNDIDYKYYNEITKTVKNNYRLWREKKRENIKEEVARTSHVESCLQQTREDIVDEREIIKGQEKDLVYMQKEANEAKKSKEERIKTLTEQYQVIKEEVSQKAMNYSNEYNQIILSKEQVEVEVVQLQERNHNELEHFRRDASALQGLESRLADMRQKQYAEKQELLNRMIDAKHRYKDARKIFEEAYAVIVKQKKEKEAAIAAAEKSTKRKSARRRVNPQPPPDSEPMIRSSKK